jgi:hypothetical protein
LMINVPCATARRRQQAPSQRQSQQQTEKKTCHENTAVRALIQASLERQLAKKKRF